MRKVWFAGLALVAVVGGGLAAIPTASAGDRPTGALAAAETSWTFKYRGATSCEGSRIGYDVVFYVYDTSGYIHTYIPGGAVNLYLPDAAGRANYNAPAGDLAGGLVATPVQIGRPVGGRTLVRYHLRVTSASAGFLWISMAGWGVHLDFRAARCPGAPVRIRTTTGPS